MWQLVNLQTKEILGYYKNRDDAESELRVRFLIPVNRIVNADSGSEMYFYADRFFDTPNYGFRLTFKSGVV